MGGGAAGRKALTSPWGTPLHSAAGGKHCGAGWVGSGVSLRFGTQAPFTRASSGTGPRGDRPHRGGAAATVATGPWSRGLGGQLDPELNAAILSWGKCTWGQSERSHGVPEGRLSAWGSGDKLTRLPATLCTRVGAPEGPCPCRLPEPPPMPPPTTPRSVWLREETATSEALRPTQRDSGCPEASCLLPDASLVRVAPFAAVDEAGGIREVFAAAPAARQVHPGAPLLCCWSPAHPVTPPMACPGRGNRAASVAGGVCVCGQGFPCHPGWTRVRRERCPGCTGQGRTSPALSRPREGRFPTGCVLSASPVTPCPSPAFCILPRPSIIHPATVHPPITHPSHPSHMHPSGHCPPSPQPPISPPTHHPPITHPSPCSLLSFGFLLVKSRPRGPSASLQGGRGCQPSSKPEGAC